MNLEIVLPIRAEILKDKTDDQTKTILREASLTIVRTRYPDLGCELTYGLECGLVDMGYFQMAAEPVQQFSSAPSNVPA